MSENAGSVEGVKPTRIRSPSYPYIDLGTAIARTQQLYNFAKKTPVLLSAVLKEWGYSGSSANGMKVIAALKSFGLIRDIGKGKDRKVVISDFSYRLLHYPPDSPEKEAAIKEAALKPPMYSFCWREWGAVEEMPGFEAIKSHLVLEKKFNPDAVSGFLSDYKKTIQFAKLGQSDTIESEDGEESIDPNLQNIAEKKGIININPPPKRPGMNQDTFTLDEGQVVIQWPKNLSPESFEDFESWLQLVLRKTKRSLANPKAPAEEKDQG